MLKSGKGQYLSLEQMVLFTVSVVVTVSIYFSFSASANRVQSATSEDQLREVGEEVVAGISKVYLAKDKDYIKLKLQIPKKISGEAYKIKTFGNKIKVVGKTREVAVDLGAITDFVVVTEASGYSTGVSSSKGELLITLENGEIKLGR